MGRGSFRGRISIVGPESEIKRNLLDAEELDVNERMNQGMSCLTSMLVMSGKYPVKASTLHLRRQSALKIWLLDEKFANEF